MPRKSWERCGQGDLGAIECGLSAHTHTAVSQKTTTTVLLFAEACMMLLKSEKVKTLMICMTSSLNDSLTKATIMSVHATLVLRRSLESILIVMGHTRQGSYVTPARPSL